MMKVANEWASTIVKGAGGNRKPLEIAVVQELETGTAWWLLTAAALKED